MATLTIRNYSTNLVEFTLNALKSLGKAIAEARMRSAMVHIQREFMQFKSYRDTYKELSKLSDRELNDIGLTRGEIHYIAMDAYRKDVMS